MEELSLEAAYRSWAPDLVAFAATVGGSESAADAVADVFQRLLADPDRWAAVSNPRSYLLRSVANSARAIARSDGRRRAREDRDWSMTCPEGGDAASSSSLLVDRSLQTALSTLSSQQRSVVFLTYWLDESVVGAAEILGVRPGTVRRQLARARQKLRGALS